MTLLARNTNPQTFCRQPPTHVHGALLYGSDVEQVSIYADLLAQAICPDRQDPFLIEQIYGHQLKDDPSLLPQVMASRPLMGGRRLIWLREIGDSHAAGIVSILDYAGADTFLLIAAPELKKTSALYKAFETATHLMVIACYEQEGAALNTTLLGWLKAEKLTLDADGMAALRDTASHGLQQARQAVEKLALYAGGAASLTGAEVRECLHLAHHDGMDDLAYAWLAGQAAKALQARAAQADMPAPALVRTTQNLLLRIMHAKTLLAEGKDRKVAAKMLKPPLFFKDENRFYALVQKLSWQDLQRWSGVLLALDTSVKRQHILDELVFEQAMLTPLAV